MKGQKSIIVTGASVQECLKKVSKKYKIDIKKLGYKIIEKGEKGMMGLGKHPYKIKVFPKKQEKKTESVSDNMLDAALAIGESLDGYFKIEKTEGKILLTVFPPNGKGAPISVFNVEKKLEEDDIKIFDKDKVKDAVYKMSAEPVEIGTYKVDSTLNGTCEVEISDDQMECYMSITAAQPGGINITTDAVIEKLNENNVTVNIDKSAIEDAVIEKIFNEKILVATGIPVENGKNAEVKYNFQIEDAEKSFVENETGQVDYKNVGAIIAVQENDVLAELIKEPTPGVKGKTVTGKELQPLPGELIDFKPGENTMMSDDEKKIIAKINGMPVLRDGIVDVDKVYVIKGNVGLDTGNIIFDGTVKVEGRVEDEFEIQATGDVFVKGSVGKAKIEAQENIEIAGGIAGKGEAVITSGKNITATFIENANIFAGQSLFVKKAIMHSNIVAAKELIMDGRGQIVGGEVKVGRLIDVKEIGAIGTRGTEIEVGINPRLTEVLKQISAKEVELDNKRKQVNTVVQRLKSKSDEEGLDEATTAKFKQLLRILEQLSQQLNDIKKEKEEAKQKFAPYKDAVIKVQNRIFRGTKITICKAHMTVKDELKFVKLKLSKGNISTDSYN